MQNIFSDESLSGMRSFVAEIHDQMFIRSNEARSASCALLLNDSTFVDEMQMKYDFTQFLSEGVLETDREEIGRQTVSITAGLTNTQKNILVQNNGDYIIKFIDSAPTPHALAYAQRVIDTARCRSVVNHRVGTVIDFGGNYATHAMSGVTNIHCCTLVDDVEELHRQTQRLANLEMAGIEPVSYCQQGIENCDVEAKEAISLHTLPRVHPDKLPDIFHRHGINYMTGVHHYTAEMDHGLSGFCPDVDMHWRVVGSNIEFYFEGDNSFSYSHDKTILQSYAKTNYFTSDKYSFVIYYEVDRMDNGCLYWTMLRLQKDTLDNQILQKQYRYTVSDPIISIQVPVYNKDGNFANNDPRAYSLQTKIIPSGLFEYVYKAGVSNDTSNPTLPLTFSTIRDYVQTYNHVRSVNGTSITAEHKLPTLEAEQIALGLYLVIVNRAAAMRVTTTEYTKVFQRVQKKWGDENFALLLAKCFSKVVLLPFLMLADDFNQVVDLMTIHMRSVINSQKLVSAVTEELPYYVLSPVSEIPGYAKTQFEIARDEVPTNVEFAHDTEVGIQEFYDNFKDELSQEHVDILLKKIKESQEKSNEVVQEQVKSLFPSVLEDRDSWQVAKKFLLDSVSVSSLKLPVVRPRDEVLEHVFHRIYEAGLYNLDVALNVVGNAKLRCGDTWSGNAPSVGIIASRNNTTDLGIKYLRVADGLLMNPDEAAEYTVAMDPISRELIYLPEKGHTMMVATNAQYIFVFDPFKIFNNFKISKVLLSASGLRKPDYKLTLVDGVPGCGKTYEITNSFKSGDLIACAVRSTADSTLEQVVKRFPTIQKKRIRSADSCIMHGVPTASTLYFDEGLMVLPGVIDHVAVSSKAQNVQVFGDSVQIGFVDRGSNLGTLMFQKYNFFEEIVERNITNRMPGDVTAAIRRFYPEERRDKIKTRSNIRRSVTYEYVPDINDGRYSTAEASVHLMTLLSQDKGKFTNRPGYVDGKLVSPGEQPSMSRVLTIHESQGLTVSHSTIARLSVFANPIFDSPTHQLVAFSRHTHTCVVRSTVETDPYLLLAKAIMDVTEEEIDQVMIDTPEYISEPFAKVKPRGIL